MGVLSRGHQCETSLTCSYDGVFLVACAGAGGGAGGVPMEVWCRYYYPNTRDQVIAKVGHHPSKLYTLWSCLHRAEMPLFPSLLKILSFEIFMECLIFFYRNFLSIIWQEMMTFTDFLILLQQ